MVINPPRLFRLGFRPNLVCEVAVKCRKTLLLIALALLWVPGRVDYARGDEGQKTPATLAPLRDRFAHPSSETLETPPPNFQRHIVPLLGRLGCNGRSCHGSFQGQGGFRLSMFGYDFKFDHEALLGGDPARVDRRKVDESLVLKKPSNEDDHDGGKRFALGSWEHRVLRSWIENGAPNDAHPLVKMQRLEVTPAEILFADVERKPVTLRVIAQWSDGSREDVTCLTRYSTNDDGVAQVDSDGVVRSLGKGSTHIIACYDSGVVAVPVLRPVSDRVGSSYPPVPTPTKIDELVVGKLRKLGIVQSETCTDAEFLRRASLDICGTLPTPDEVTAFLADPTEDKRTRKIEEFLARPEYALWWATKLCDFTGLNAPAQLGNTDFASLVGPQWYDWIERRVSENVGYNDLVRGIVMAVSVLPGETYEEYISRQTSYVRKQEPVDFAAQPWMPYFWFRANLSTADDRALGFAYTFLGVRLDCAQCHKHPFDQWSQQDFKDFTQFFDRVSRGIHPDRAADKKAVEERLETAKLDTAAKRRQTFLKWVAEGKPAVWSEIYIADMPAVSPKEDAKKASDFNRPLRLLGGREVVLKEGQDPREPVLEWMFEKDNPYFAKAFVNRVWAHYFGVGIVNPPDDANLGNPPSNRELLDYLASEFVAHGYDMRWLHREITTSRTYQLSWKANETNRDDERLFSRAIVRRLPAEVIGDALKQATAGTAIRRAATPKELRTRYIAQQAPAYERALEYSMLVFGKPIRKTNCDCERDPQPSLLQAVYLRNDADLRTIMHRKDSWLAQLSVAVGQKKESQSPGELIQEAYLRCVSRIPTAAEMRRCETYFADTTDHNEALDDLIWALLNTQEFLTNH